MKVTVFFGQHSFTVFATGWQHGDSSDAALEIAQAVYAELEPDGPPVCFGAATEAPYTNFADEPGAFTPPNGPALNGET